MRAPVIRISLGFFDADKAELVATKLAETRERLKPGIRAMRTISAISPGFTD